MHINPLKRNCILGCERSDSAQHNLQCLKKNHYIAYPKGILSPDDLVRKTSPSITTSYDSENDIISFAMCLAVFMIIYHMFKDKFDTDPYTQLAVSATATMPDASMLPAAAECGAELPRDKGVKGVDPWHDSATKHHAQ